MGLDASCNEVSVKCGSYDSVATMQTELLIGLKDYLEMESLLEEKEKDPMIDALVEMLQREVNYSQYTNLFWRFELDGFFPFLAIQDQGSMTSYEARRFLKTFKMVRSSLRRSVLRDCAHLRPVFEESIRSDNDVHFF